MTRRDPANLPPDTTVDDLAQAKDLGLFSALHAAAGSGNLPPDTTVQDLANTKDNNDYSGLHAAAKAGKYSDGTTIADLAAAKDGQGRTALHCAAYHDHLPEKTDARALYLAKADDRTTALEVLNPKRIRDVLDATTAANCRELRELGENVSKANPIAAAIWMTRELKRINNEKFSAPTSRKLNS
jgi:ankyrin repeat protein